MKGRMDYEGAQGLFQELSFLDLDCDDGFRRVYAADSPRFWTKATTWLELCSAEMAAQTCCF